MSQSQTEQLPHSDSIESQDPRNQEKKKAKNRRPASMCRSRWST